MSVSHWRQKSRRVILDAIRSGRASGLSGKDLERHVSAAYPFGERAMWPYKIWLEEFNVLVRGRRKLSSKGKPAGPKLLGEWPGLTPEQRDALAIVTPERKGGAVG